MKTDQLDRALCDCFGKNHARLVFWHDPDGEFADHLAQGLPQELDGVTVIDVVEHGGLPTKLLVERQDPQGRYLLYRQGSRPPTAQDWLLDIRLYSTEFQADVASLWREELGLSHLSVHEHLEARRAFLASKERRRRLERLVAHDDGAAALDLKMLAVLTGSEVPSPHAVLRALCHSHIRDGHPPLSSPPRVLGQLEKMALAEPFWALMAREFGYTTDTPSIAGLLRRLFVSELLALVDGADLPALQHYALPAPGRRSAQVLLTHWRDSAAQAASYDTIAAAIEAELGLRDLLGPLPTAALARAFTFWAIDQALVARLRSHVLEEAQAIDIDTVRAQATQRQTGHWLSGPGSDQPTRTAVHQAYEAIVAAAGLFALRNLHHHRLDFPSPRALLTAYQTELFRFDQRYRTFCARARPATAQGWDLLKTLASQVERVYDQGFLKPLGRCWSRLLDEGFLDVWALEELPPQQHFYDQQVRPWLAGSDRRRAYVIISDALRYAAADSLTQVLQGTNRLDAELEAMLGVLPSTTTLGMASLLPHQTLAYSDKGDVLTDGRSVAGTDSRNKQLQRFRGLACQAKALRAMKASAARDFVGDTRVVYIYHNVIDARGDTASTESETFEAVEQCIRELADLVRFCVNKLSASRVQVTADHGFLFQEQAPSQTDRSGLSHRPAHTIKAKKRYVVGRQLGTSPEAHRGTTQVTAGTLDDMGFWVPRGSNRFHFTGGARFVHGGAMPQEVVVPLVTVTRLRGDRAQASRTEPVGVQVLGSRHKITTPTHRFELIQTEAVGPRRRARRLKAAIYDGAQAVTSVETVVLDSASDSMNARKQDLRLALGTGPFDKSRPYRLVLRDAQTEAEVHTIPVIIDRSFTDDF